MTLRTMLSIALLALAGAGCRSEVPPAPPPDPKVVGDHVEFPPHSPQLASLAVEPAGTEGGRTTRLSGRLTWDENATVRVFTPFAGRVKRLFVDVGTTVTSGAPLAEVESPDFGQAQAEARTAESDLRLAESNLSRLHELYEHGAAPLKDLEAAEADEARAASQHARARARLDSYGAAADSVTGVFLLRSPISGTVVERTVTPGEEIRPDQMLANAPQLFSPLFVLSDPSRLWIQIDATEAEMSCLRPGARFRFANGAFPDRDFEGRIERVSEEVDPVTHTVKARGVVDNTRHLLKAEMFVSVDLPSVDTREVSLPSQAVFLKGDHHYVFVEQAPGTFARREVLIGDEHDTHVLISAGIHSGERVVTDGCILLEQLFD